jgi:hypothetical protein
MKRYKYVINKNKFLEKWYEITVKHLQCELPLVIRAFNESYGPGTYDIYFEHYFELLSFLNLQIYYLKYPGLRCYW